jgi:hypothetical protein
MLWKTSIVHGTSKFLWSKPFVTEVASFMAVTAPATWVSCVSLRLCAILPKTVSSVWSDAPGFLPTAAWPQWGVAEVTMLHAVGMGELELSPLLEVKSSSLGDSSSMACNDGGPLRAMPPTTVLESSPSGNKCNLLRWSTMNSRSLKRMDWSWVSSMPN